MRRSQELSDIAPVPRSGGLVVMSVILAGLGWLLFTHRLDFPTAAVWLCILGGGLFTGLVAGIDGWRQTGLHVRWRFVTQALVVLPPLVLLPAEHQIFYDYMTVIPERILLGLAWIWFVNLWTYMDGIRSMSAVQAGSISGGIIALSVLAGLPLENGFTELNLIIGGAALGFLFWNARPQARIRLGDIGSTGFGYVLGWMLIMIALQGNGTVALLLPLVYLTDALVTLGLHTFQRKKLRGLQRRYFYQQATHIKGLSDLKTTAMVLVINLLLIVLAATVVMEMLVPWQALLGGLILVKILLLTFYKIGRPGLALQLGRLLIIAVQYVLAKHRMCVILHDAFQQAPILRDLFLNECCSRRLRHWIIGDNVFLEFIKAQHKLGKMSGRPGAG